MVFTLIWLVFAVALGALAKQRGRGAFNWFLIGTALSPLLGLALLMMGKDVALSEAMDTITHDMDMTHVKCPKCIEYVMPDAIACPYCQAVLQPDPEYVKQRMAEKLIEEKELRQNRQVNFMIAAGVAAALVMVAGVSTLY
jgi:hypothetical protein